MQIVFDLPRLSLNFDVTIKQFLELLRSLEKLRLFDQGWEGLGNKLWDEESQFIEAYRAWNDQRDLSASNPAPSGEFGSAGVLSQTTAEDGNYSYYTVELRRGHEAVNGSHLVVDIGYPHPTFGLDLKLYSETIECVIHWLRPYHVSMVGSAYRMEHHALDAQRRGFGWLGWVPFELSSTQVPEAAIVEPMADGTFLASQPDFWFAGGPNKDDAAIAGAQALELRLNSLGVLPTVVELREGTWGQ